MDIYVARQLRLGFGTVAMLTHTQQPKAFKDAAQPVLIELESVIKGEEESQERSPREKIMSISLRVCLDELKRFVDAEPTKENIQMARHVCKNITINLRSS